MKTKRNQKQVSAMPAWVSKLMKQAPEFESVWNRRTLTAKDFHRICDARGVMVMAVPRRKLAPSLRTKFKGVFTIVDGTPAIAIISGLSKVDRALVAWHELGHHLLHSHLLRKFRAVGFHDQGRRELEYEAERFAACALIPLPVLKKYSADEIHQQHGYPMKFIALRQGVFQRSGV